MTELRALHPVVFLLDQERTICVTSALILEKAGLNVVWADDRVRALDIINQNLIYVFLFDPNSKFKDGTDPEEIFARVRRANPFCSAIIYTTSLYDFAERIGDNTVSHRNPDGYKKIQHVLHKPAAIKQLTMLVSFEMNKLLLQRRDLDGTDRLLLEDLAQENPEPDHRPILHKKKRLN